MLSPFLLIVASFFDLVGSLISYFFIRIDPY